MVKTVVAVCLIGIGIVILFGVVGKSVYGFWRTRAEMTVPAHLIKVELLRGVGRGRSSSTKVEYEYVVQGRSYGGDRVSLFRYTSQFYRPLAEALAQDRAIEVHIDPAHPGFAVIDRKFAPYPFFVGVLFCGGFIGLGLRLHFWKP